jgi:putative ABC transport system permease protein
MTTAPPPRPPAWAERIAARRLPRDRREFVLGDLDEEFQARASADGVRAASRWYWREAWRTVFSRHPRVFHDRAHADASPIAPRILPMPSLLHDVRLACRTLVRLPAFTLTAVATLAIGIGANAAVFRVAWHVMLKPLPYAHADRLVRVWEAYSRGGRDLSNVVAPGNFVDWQRGTHVFDAFAAYNGLRSTADLTGVGDPAQLEIRSVTADYFDVFGMAPLTGRTLGATDARDDVSTVVLSEALWRQRFGADPHAVGRTIDLSGTPYTIVGVMPEAFGVSAGPTIDAWIGRGFSPDEIAAHGAHYLGIVARLKPGVTIDTAIADVKAAAARDSLAFPDTNKNTSATVVSIESERGGTFRSAIGLLSGAAAFVLLIACANLASLQLVRGLSRARELSVRAALGASRGQLVRQLLLEAIVVATAGGVAGLAVSSWTMSLLAHVAPTALRAGTAAGLDAATIAWTAGLSLASVILFALAPAWRATSSGTRWISQRTATGDRHAAGARTALVVGQLALAVVLVVSATLLVVSLARVVRVDPGFDPGGVAAFDLSLPGSRYPTVEARRELFQRVFDEVGAIPGVTAVCGINAIPFDQPFNMTYVPEGQTAPIGSYPRTVTPGCFDVLRVHLIAGRLFTDHETTRVGIVTQRFAHLAWGDAPAVGQRLHVGVAAGAVVEIVGVVSDSLQNTLEAPVYPQVYESASTSRTFPPQSVMLRASVPPTSIFGAVRAAVRRVDVDQPVARLRSLDDVVGASMAERRFDLGLFGGFAIIALVLSAVGIYGLFAYLVAERRAEIGIRMALGARPEMVVQLMLKRAWIASGIGLAIGIGGAYAIATLLRGFMFGVSTTDPRVYAGVAITLGAMAILAAWVPSRRAARVDPAAVLRNA